MHEDEKRPKKDEQTLWFKLAIAATLLMGSSVIFRDEIKAKFFNREVQDSCSVATVEQEINVFVSDQNQNSDWRKVDGHSVGSEPVLVKSDFDQVSVEEDIFGRKIGMLHLTENGAQKLFHFSASGVGKSLAVVVDDHIVATFEMASMGLNSAISIQGNLHGYASSEDVVYALCSAH